MFVLPFLLCCLFVSTMAAAKKQDKFELRKIFMTVSDLPAYQNEWYHVDFWAEILLKECGIDHLGYVVSGSLRS